MAAPELTDSWPPRYKGAFFKEPRGSATLKKEQAAREDTADEIAIKKLVRLRDGKCRCLIPHKCRGGMHVIHLVDRSLGGAFVTTNLWLGCAWVHNKGPKTIHSKDIEVRPRGKHGMDGLCDWFAREWSEGRKDFRWVLVAKESAPGVVQK